MELPAIGIELVMHLGVQVGQFLVGELAVCLGIGQCSTYCGFDLFDGKGFLLTHWYRRSQNLGSKRSHPGVQGLEPDIGRGECLLLHQSGLERTKRTMEFLHYPAQQTTQVGIERWRGLPIVECFVQVQCAVLIQCSGRGGHGQIGCTASPKLVTQDCFGFGCVFSRVLTRINNFVQVVLLVVALPIIELVDFLTIIL